MFCIYLTTVQLKERHIGFLGFAADFAQGIIVKKFPVVLFYRFPGIVKQIHPPGRHPEIGHEDMINIFGILEQSKLFGFLGIFLDRTPDYDKPMRALPFLMDIFGEFPEDSKKINIGDYYSSYKKFKSVAGWEPKTSYADGFKETLEYYKKNHRYYW